MGLFSVLDGNSMQNTLQNTQQQAINEQMQNQVDELNTQMQMGKMTSQSNQQKTVESGLLTMSNNSLNTSTDQQTSSKNEAEKYSAN
jgi:hypothetical protein